MSSATIAREGTRPTVTQSALAWGVTLALLSRLPEIVAREVFHIDTAWISWLWLGSAALFFALSFVWPAARSLRRYFLIMLIILSMTGLVDPGIRGSSLWASWFGGAQSPVRTLLAERILLALETLVVIGALAAMRFRRRDYYLTTGNLNAPVGGLRIPGVSRPITWGVVGPALAILLTLLYVAVATTFVPPTASLFARALPRIPLALLAALLNSFCEEMLYRAALSIRSMSPPLVSTTSRQSKMAPLMSSITLSRPKAIKRRLPARIPARIPAPMATTASIIIHSTVKTSSRTPARTSAARNAFVSLMTRSCVS
jgi:hypothetical protein